MLVSFPRYVPAPLPLIYLALTRPAEHHAYTIAEKRPAQSQDNTNVLGHPDKQARGHGDDEIRLRQEIESLQKRLKEATSRAEYAERATDDMERRLKAATNEVIASNNSLEYTVKQLQSQNQNLKTELDDARSHIFGLQPYIKDLMPEEVGRVSLLWGPGTLPRTDDSRTMMPFLAIFRIGCPSSSIPSSTIPARWKKW